MHVVCSPNPTSTHHHPRLPSALEALLLSHNQLAALPPQALGLASVRELGLGHNRLEELAGPLHLMASLQVGGAACTRSINLATVQAAAGGAQHNIYIV